MIPSGTITLSPAVHAAATASLRDRLADLEERRVAAERTVAGLLSTWHGEAAVAFRERWEEWDRGARAVLDQLAGTVVCLDRARHDLTETDGDRADAVVQLAGRLG